MWYKVTDKEWDTIIRLVDERELTLANLYFLDHWSDEANAENNGEYQGSPSAVIDWLKTKPPKDGR
jgi:hypothetical protein